MKPWVLAAVLLVPISSILTPVSARGDALDNWTPSQVISTGFAGTGPELLGLAYGNGRYVAVGEYTASDYSAVQTSDDGMNWTKRDPYSVYDLFTVTYGNGMFVACGWDYYSGQNIYNSTDGINWTRHTTGIVNVYGVTYGGILLTRKFVAVGDGQLLEGSGYTNRQIFTSPDGTNWTGVASGAPAGGGPALKDVTYGANRFVAVDDGGYIHTSTGSGWTRNQVGGSPGPISYGFVNFCNGRFIALFSSGTNFVSSDGLSWSPMVKNTTNILSRVIYAGGVYVAIGAPLYYYKAFTNVFTSVDGTNWLLRSLPVPTNAALTSLLFANDRVMVGGYKIPTEGSLSYDTLALAYLSDSLAGVSIKASSPAQLTISGLVGRSYRIDYVTGLQPGSNNWQPLATISLTNSPQNWSDTTATNSQRYYRTVLLP